MNVGTLKLCAVMPLEATSSAETFVAVIVSALVSLTILDDIFFCYTSLFRVFQSSSRYRKNRIFERTFEQFNSFMDQKFKSRVIKGEEFNEIFPEVIKFTNASANHRGVIFEVGKIVTDPLPWSDGECKPGGIYFTTKDHMKEWYSNYSTNIGKICRAFAVSVRPEAKVAVYPTKAKATSIEVLRELDYDMLVEDFVREDEEEQKRREEERKRKEEEQKRRLAIIGVTFHKNLKPETVENLPTELASNEIYPLVLELVNAQDHDINDAKFDKIYRAITKAILRKYAHLCFAPFLSPRLLHIANLEFSRYCLSYYFEKEEIELMDRYPEFFSTQPYSKHLARHLTYLYPHEFPNIQKALGMI